MAPPTILFVHGAWHQPSAYTPFTDLLVQRGHQFESVTLPSTGSDLGEQSVDADVSAVASTIERLADKEVDIVMFVHSYGGIPASSACEGLLKSDRAKVGKSGGVVHIIYCAAFLLPAGVSLLSVQPGGKPLDWWGISKDGRQMTIVDPAHRLYNDIEDEAELQRLIRALKTQPSGSFWKGPTYEAWHDVDFTYVLCEKDNAILIDMQRALVNNAKRIVGEKGGMTEVNKVEMNTGHSPWASQPEALADVVEKIVKSVSAQ